MAALSHTSKRIVLTAGLLALCLIAAAFMQVSGGQSGVTGSAGAILPNSGAVGAIPNYVAAGGNSVLSPDPFFSSNDAGVLSIGGAGSANNGGITYFGLTSGSITMGCTNATCTQWGGNNVINVGKITTNGNCAANGTAANPSVVTCAAASSGTVDCSVTASAGTCTVNTTQTTANSVITITQGNFGTGGTGRLGVTCNTATIGGAFVSAVAAGTSFTITLPTFATNPMCFTYIVNN